MVGGTGLWRSFTFLNKRRSPEKRWGIPRTRDTDDPANLPGGGGTGIPNRLNLTRGRLRDAPGTVATATSSKSSTPYLKDQV